MTITGFDLGHPGTVEAEHWLAALLGGLPAVSGVVACTHLVHGARPRVVVTVSGIDLPVAADSSAAASAAVADHAAGRAGRAFWFPGVRDLTGTMRVTDLLSSSAIDEVRVMGAAPPDPETKIDTRAFVRPQWLDGSLVLMATPAPGGLIAPFEVPNPTPCCGGAH